jgi:hypothetical protein
MGGKRSERKTVCSLMLNAYEFTGGAAGTDQTSLLPTEHQNWDLERRKTRLLSRQMDEDKKERKTKLN